MILLILSLYQLIIIVIFKEGTKKKHTKKVDSNYTKPPGYTLFQDAESWTQQGAALVSLYKFEEALFCYDKALKSNQKYIPAKENKSFLMRLLGWNE